MGARISDTDLILNRDGSVYHLNLRPEHIYDTIITVGDQNRVAQVSQFFDHVDFRISQREFITHGGVYKGRPVTVISTGIGTDNVEIVLTEIDALVNVDLVSHEVKSEHRKLNIIRIGTSGSLQEDIPVGSELVSDYAIGFDNLIQFYHLEQSEHESRIATDIRERHRFTFTPYVVQGSRRLKEKVGYDLISGNTITAPGFYGPQGRTVRIANRYPNLLEDLRSYHYSPNFRLDNFEMETAGYYALGRVLGHEMLSVNAILANRITKEFAREPGKIVESLIGKVLDRI